MKFRAALLAAASMVFPLEARGAAGQPWEMTAEEQSRLNKDLKGKAWYEMFEEAVGLLEEAPKRSDGRDALLEKAIGRLKFVISIKPASDPSEFHPVAKRDIAYFPYFRLGQAFWMRGRSKEALVCTERELKSIASSPLGKDYQRLLGDAQAAAGSEQLREVAETIVQWGTGAGDLILSTPRTQIDQIKSDAQKLANPSGTDIKATSEKLRKEISDLAIAELGHNRPTLTDAGYQPALKDRTPRVDAQACDPPSGVLEAGKARDAVESCGKETLRAMRLGGQWICDRLQSRRTAVQTLSLLQVQWTARETGKPLPQSVGSSEQIPSLPKACETARWQNDPAATIASQFDQVKSLQQVEAPIEKARVDLERRIEEKRTALKNKLHGIAVPDLGRTCESQLRLGEFGPRLEALRKRFSPESVPAEGLPTEDLFGGEGSVTAMLGELAKAITQEVPKIVTEGKTCTGVATKNLDALQTAAQSFAKNPTASSLPGLCATAKDVETDVGNCWVRDIDAVRSERDVYGRLVQTASAGFPQHPSAAASNEEDGACFARASTAFNSLSPSPRSGQQLEWVKTARADVSEARACLGRFHTVTSKEFDNLKALVGNLEKLEKAAPPGGGTAAEGQDLKPRLDRMKADVADARRWIDVVDLLYAAKPDSFSSIDLKKVLEGAGLAGSLSAGAWTNLQAVKDNPELQFEWWRTIRDSTVRLPLGHQSTTLGAHKPIVPFLYLHGAFDSLARGDLDHAILAARGAESIDVLGSEDAALVHASLSYFLFLKLRSIEKQAPDQPRQGPLDLLKKDAEREALRARTNVGFKLPAFLAAHSSFQKFFDALAPQAN